MSQGEEIICVWEPEIIVSLVSELAWPIVVLVLGYRYRNSLRGTVKNFLRTNRVKGFSVSASGAVAEFERIEQEAHESKDLKPSDFSIPEGGDAQGLKKGQAGRATQYSHMLLENINQHIAALSVNDDEKIGILSTEVSLLQASILYIEICSVLFRSQYDLFNERFFPSNRVSKSDVAVYFSRVRAASPDAYGDWDADKYMSYPLAAGLIESRDDSFILTALGHSFVSFMRQNPGLTKWFGQL